MFTQWEFKDWQQSSASDKQAPETGLDLDKHGYGGVFHHLQWDQQGVLTLRSVWVLTPQYIDGDNIL